MATNGSELFLDRNTRVRKIQQIAAFLAQIEGKDPQVTQYVRAGLERKRVGYRWSKRAFGTVLYLVRCGGCGGIEIETLEISWVVHLSDSFV